MKTSICVQTQFKGMHFWPDAPEAVSFLRDRHRHIFHVKATIPVSHDDRQLEFFMVKDNIDEFISTNFYLAPREFLAFANLENMSCEMMATEILLFLKRVYDIKGIKIEVAEDNENSAIVEDI